MPSKVKKREEVKMEGQSLHLKCTMEGPQTQGELLFFLPKRCLGLADWRPTVAEGPLITRPTFLFLLYQVFVPCLPAELQQSNGESATFTGPRNQ